MRGAARRPTSAGETAAVSGSLQNQAAGDTPCLLPNTANKTQVGGTGNGAQCGLLAITFQSTLLAEDHHWSYISHSKQRQSGRLWGNVLRAHSATNR